MVGWILLAVILAVLIIFVLVVLIRAALFRPPQEESAEFVPVEVNRDKVVADMAEMVRCRTVSSREEELVEWDEFRRFRELLPQIFPRIHAACTCEEIGRTGLLYHLPGKRSDSPTVCMAHYDVVPVEEGWTVPAFDGLIRDGFIWGRGTLDTKCTLCAVMEALEELLGQGYIPEQDLYLSFSGEEEINGSSCVEIVSVLESRGVCPGLVLDEGGAVVENVFPGVSRESAMVGIGEKGSANISFVFRTSGGHASTPPVHSAVGRISKAAVRLEKKPFRCQLTQVTKEMFETLGRHSGFLFRIIFANLWCFLPLLGLFGKLTGGEINALLRTTVAVTRILGSKEYNVLPTRAKLGINVRLMGTDDLDYMMKRIKKVIGENKMEIKLIDGTNPSPCSRTDSPGWEKLKKAIRQTWPEAIVSPYLMMARSDSCNYCRISENVYRFSPMRLSKEERGLVHGSDERIPIDTLITTVSFYQRLLLII